jgi:hypothetical protein
MYRDFSQFAWCRLDYDSANNTWRRKIRQRLCLLCAPSLHSFHLLHLFRRYPSSSSSSCSSSGVTRVCKGVGSLVFFFSGGNHKIIWIVTFILGEILSIRICEYKWEISQMRNEPSGRARMNQFDIFALSWELFSLFLLLFVLVFFLLVGNQSRGIRIQIR